MEDERIIGLFFARSEEAISETTAKYGHYCRKIALNVLGNREDAEECENDVYNALWRAIPPTRPENLKVYLGRVTRNLALNRFDRNNAAKRGSGITAILAELEECVPSDFDVSEEYDNMDISAIISEFLYSQSEEVRNVFIRRYWYSDSIGSIARQTGMSQSKIKSMLFRARKLLRKHLESEGISV